MTTITFRPGSFTCPHCGIRRKVQKTTTKPISTLDIGTFIAHELKYFCPRCGLISSSDELKILVPTRCNFGYDVLVYVGEAFFPGSRNNDQIVKDLRERNINISRSEVSYLAKKFIVYLALLHKKVQKETRAFLSMNGGYILHLDGTCEGDSPHLISVLDGITEIVLDNTKVPSENTTDLIIFLKGIKEAYGDPVAVVSDMGKGILAAVRSVFENVPLFICHFHFLKNLGKELFGQENDTIRKRLKNHGIQGTLRKRVRTLGSTITTSPPELMVSFLKLIETEEIMTIGITEGLPQMIIHTLLMWVLDGKHQGQGRGFPFDQPYLIFYQRLITAYTLLSQFAKSDLCGTVKEKKLVNTIRHDLQSVIRDSVLKKASINMLDKVNVFSSLRSAMRITLPETGHGLNDDGELCSMKTIERAVTKFSCQLFKDKKRMKDKAYQKLISQIDKYSELLFCDPIVVETKAGEIIIQPQRTNNLLEQFFRTLMRTYRKKNGFQAVARILKAMLKDTPLVMNLRNKDFMEVLLDGKKNLAERFADIDSEIVREQLRKSTGTEYPVSAKLKKIISTPMFPETLRLLIGKKAS
ncbi:MAG: transposase [Spirochaetales bacterium]|nr:transposase [Spirochaetales bacterium]